MKGKKPQDGKGVGKCRSGDAHDQVGKPTKEVQRKNHKKDRKQKEDRREPDNKNDRKEKGDTNDRKEKEDKKDRKQKSPSHRKRNECILVSEYRRKRRPLQKFASQPGSLDRARKNFPYHRETAGNDLQLQFIDQLRERYTCMRNESERNHELIVRKYRLPEDFVFDTNESLRAVDLMPGLYHPDEVNQVIFANSNIGGGFLTYGMAQEEVSCCERTDWAMLIAELYALGTPIEIGEDEALVISGADMCAGVDFYGRVPDDWNDRCCYFTTPHLMESDLIAIDCVRARWKKYSLANLQKAVKKAYCGFQGATSADAITTGPWGCGAFFNNHNVMFCVQALAAWLAGKKLYYHSTYARLACGYDMVKRWHASGMKFELCFAELLARCQSDPLFETSYDPGLTANEFVERTMTHNLTCIRDIAASNSQSDTAGSSVDGKPVLRLVDYKQYVRKKWGTSPPTALTVPTAPGSAPRAVSSTPSSPSSSPRPVSAKAPSSTPSSPSSSPRPVSAKAPSSTPSSPRSPRPVSFPTPSYTGSPRKLASPHSESSLQELVELVIPLPTDTFAFSAKPTLSEQKRILNELTMRPAAASGENPQDGGSTNTFSRSDRVNARRFARLGVSPRHAKLR